MGSEVVTAVVEQLGAISVNPEELDPSVSRPILQLDPTPSFTFLPMQQITGFQTNEESSAPVEQRPGVSFSAVTNSPDNKSLEQANIFIEPTNYVRYYEH